MQHHSPFTRSRSSTLQVQGVKSAVEALSTKRIASNKDATTDRSPLLRATSQAIIPPPIKPPEKAPKSFFFILFKNLENKLKNYCNFHKKKRELDF